MGSPVSTDLPRRVTSNDGVRLLSKPVCGSVILGQMPLQPRPKAAWATLLPVELTSPSVARQTTEWFLSQCRSVDADTTEIAVLLVSELVTNAVNAMAEAATGSACIDLSLRLFPARLLVEVTDSSPRSPVLSPSSSDASTGRGLAIVDSLSQQWGYFRHNGRKIVYFTLEAGHEPEDSKDQPGVAG
jgi:anti-sigma regulatory factor (Ser/Thr protein kinase)